MRWRPADATVAVLACGVDRAYPAAHRSLLDHLATQGAVVSRAGAGLRPDAAALPGPQPADRRAHPRHRRGGGGAAQRGAQHRQLGDAAEPAADGRARAGHQRAVAGRAPADPRRRGHAGDPRRGGARAGRRRRASTSSEAPRGPARARDRLALRQQQVLDAVPGRAAAPGPTPSPARPASAWSRSAVPTLVPAASPRAGRAQPTRGWRLAALAPRPVTVARVPRRPTARRVAEPDGATCPSRWPGCSPTTSGTWSPSATSPRTPSAPTSADVAGLLEHAARLGHTDVDRLDLRTLRSWLAKQQTLGRSRTTMARRATAARVFTAWLARTGRAADRRRRQPRLAQGAHDAAAGAARRRGRRR